MNNQLDLQGNVTDILFVEKSTINYVNKGLSIHNHGSNNQIHIGRNVTFANFNIRINCNDSKIFIGDDCRLTGTVIMKLADKNQLSIGNGTSIGG